MVLGAALSDIDIKFVDGVLGQDVPDKAIPMSPDHERLPDPSIGSWRAHINAIQEIVKRNLSTALILEDDADWDVRIKDQLRDFATATRALTQPLDGTSGSYADPTYPTPKGQAEVREFQFHNLPKTVVPRHSPYGDNWDLLWVGHCGMHFPFADNRNLPKGRVVWTDQTVPQKQYLWNIDQPEDIKEQYPDHTRVVHHAQEAVCSLGYAVTQKAARQILFEIGLKDVDSAYDLNLLKFCNGQDGRGDHRCLTMQPALFQHHRPMGPKSFESDISDHGDEWQDKPLTDMVRWSVRLNAEEIMNGGRNFSDQWPDT
ncbi:hypothetical protein SLS64_008051 [Diaporthe eres]